MNFSYKVWIAVICVFALAAMTFCVMYFISRSSLKKQITALDNKNQHLTSQLYLCNNRKPTIIEKKVYIVTKDTSGVSLLVKKRVYDYITAHADSSSCDSLKSDFFASNYYADSASVTDKATIHYAAIVKQNRLSKLIFPAITVTHKEITFIRDTCLEPQTPPQPVLVERSHLGVYAKGIFWDRIYGFGLGGQYSYKGLWAVQAGLGYQVMHRGDGTKYGQPQAEVGILVNIN